MTKAATTPGDQFVELISKADPATNQKADVLIDTNVVVEFMSVGDLLREGDKHRSILELMSFRSVTSPAEQARAAKAAWLSPAHRYRQLRARGSILLMWTLAECRLVGSMLGKEVIDILERVSPLPPASACRLLTADGTAYALTTVVVQVIQPMLVARGLRLGALTEVNHAACGDDADAELLRLAERDSLPVISNEGYTQHGLSDFKANKKKKKSLRGQGRDQGVRVFSPKEYLNKQRINVSREAEAFVHACERPVIDEYLRVTKTRSWFLENLDRALDREVENKGYAAALEHVIPLYRMVLLDERDASLQDIEPPAVSDGS